MNIHFDVNRHHYAFGAHDRILIDNVAFRAVSSNEVGWVMSRPDEAGICQQFTHVELSKLVHPVASRPNAISSRPNPRAAVSTRPIRRFRF